MCVFWLMKGQMYKLNTQKQGLYFYKRYFFRLHPQKKGG
jgi:hypothetical protein